MRHKLIALSTALVCAGSALAQVNPPDAGLELLLAGAESKLIFSTHSHTLKDGSTPRGMFDGLVWIPAPGTAYDGNDGFLFMNNELRISNDPSGAVTRLRYHNGAVTEAEMWVSGLARPCSAHDSPWGTVLTHEESYDPDDASFSYVVEIDPLNKDNWTRHTAMGRAAWEQSIAHPGTREFFLMDDARPTGGGGGFYKFVPDRWGDLSSGKLFVFKVPNDDVLAESSVGQWIEIDDPVMARDEAQIKGTLWDRPEDIEYNPADDRLYLMMTGDSRAENPERTLGLIYAFDPYSNTMELWLNARDSEGQDFKAPDNLDIDPAGNLWVTEDGIRGTGINNRLLMITPDKQVTTVMMGADENGEVSGVLWKPDGSGFWVEWQHGQDDNKYGGADFDELYEVTLPASMQVAKPWIYRNVPTAIVEVEGAALPENFNLGNATPNPFNPATTIRFEIPHSSRVELAVYNISGQKIATLTNREMQAGTYVADWDGRDSNGRLVASGTYIYTLRAGEFVESKKMSLLK